MPATHIAEITDTAILHRIRQITGASITWSGTGHSQADLDGWNDEAYERAKNLTVAEVREALGNELAGDDAAGEIDMAISIAAEPDDLTEDCMVEVHFGV